MRYIDFHCDTLTELGEGETLKKNNKSVDIEGLTKAGVLVQCCSMFVPTGLIGNDESGMPLPPLERDKRIKGECDRIYSVYCREMQYNIDCLRPVLKFDDVKDCINDGKTGILLTIEDGGVLAVGGSNMAVCDVPAVGGSNVAAGGVPAVTGSDVEADGLWQEEGRETTGSLENKNCQKVIENLENMYNKGVRLITLTWNHENCLGYPNSENKYVMAKGLKKTGIEAVLRMNELGIIVDVSHLSDGGFYQVAELMAKAKRPFIASHSNARAVTGHQRNMTDNMIRVLADNGGIMGLNLSPHFLNDIEPKNGSSRIADMVRHILHIRSVGGAEVLAIGSDFDGIEGQLQVKNPPDFEMLWSALEKAGVSNRELEKIWQGNGLRVLSEVI